MPNLLELIVEPEFFLCILRGAQHAHDVSYGHS